MREPFEEDERPQPPIPKEPLTKREARSAAFGAMLAGLTVGLIFIGGAVIFLLFCVFVWFR